MECHDAIANKSYGAIHCETSDELYGQCPFPGPETEYHFPGPMNSDSSEESLRHLHQIVEDEEGIRLVALRRGPNSNLVSELLPSPSWF